jgi:transposase-like protein
MRRYSGAVKADVRRRTSPPNHQSVARISAELGIHIVTLYNWKKTWQSALRSSERRGAAGDRL